MSAQIAELRCLCRLYNYELVVDTHPHMRPDALGTPGLSDEVQVCRGRVIAASPTSQCLTYGVSHELAHGLVGFCDEKAVLYEQATILARWVSQLLKDIETHERINRTENQ